MKFHWDHIQWGRSPKDPNYYFYYFYWWIWIGWEKMGDMSMFGIYKTWHDGPHVILRLGPIILSWSTPWTTYNKDM